MTQSNLKQQPQFTPVLKNRIIEWHFGKRGYDVNEIARELGVGELWSIEEVIISEREYKKNFLKEAKKLGASYKGQLVEWVKYARTTLHQTYYEIAKELGFDEMEIYDIIFTYEVTPSSTKKYLKNAFTREEKQYRREAMTRINKENHLTLEQIAQMFHLTKQRVSAIFQEMGYKPVSTHTIKRVVQDKYLPQFKDMINEDIKNQLDTLRKEVRTTKQRASVAKYHYNKIVIALRCKYLEKIMKTWDEDDRADYTGNRRVLINIYKELSSDKSNYTEEFSKVSEILHKMCEFEKANNIEIKLDKLPELLKK